jgi:serine protease Do
MPEKESKKGNSILVKAAIIGVVAGLLGGGVAYAGLSQFNDNSASAPQATISSDSSTGSAKTTSSSKANGGQMTGAFNRVKGAVVSVINLQRQKSSSDEDELFGLFGGESQGKSKSNSSKLETYSEGSGVIYMKANGKGYIVTNNHVVSGSDKLQVILSNGKKVSAKLVGKDSVTDLAVLTINSKYVTQTAQFGSSKKLQPGETVIAVGSPLGSEYATSVTQGIISAPSRTVQMSDSNGNASSQAKVIQTDAAINPGNSGGPLVNSAGQVIGINSMKLSQSSDGTSVEGMGFAIPSDEVVVIINQLVKNGKITRPQLGIRVADINELTAYGRRKLNIPSSAKSGVYVASVNRGGSGSQAGLRQGDIITKADGKKVDDVSDLHTILYTHKLGDTISLEVLRGGSTKTLSVNLVK